MSTKHTPGPRYTVSKSSLVSDARPWVVWLREPNGVLRLVSNGFRLRRAAREWAAYLETVR